ncbi:MAG: two-component system chemotaxis sensor kinase CheA [Desulforhopalus sp.]|jgi:two-component system chemotaxis sensor kinase CheA
MEIEDDEILAGFIEESLEHLADIETDLLTIEDAGADIDEDLVNKVFRAAHSIKGGAGFMGLTAIQGLSHSAENVLGMIRSKKLIPTPEIVNVLLMASDQLQHMIEDVHNSNDVDISSHVNPLDAIADGTFSQPPVEPVQEPPTEPDGETPNIVESETVAEEIVEETPPEPEVETAPPPPTPPVLPTPAAVDPTPPKAKAKAKAAPPAKAETSLRVHVSLLDSLMNLAGELVLSRNQLLQTIGSDDLRNAEAVGQRIDLITSELQEAIMLTRMQPIGNVFSKFPRVVRDLSSKLNKTIDLTIVGQDVELDKTIIESINDPLTHLVRNSVDHGIEMPADRKKINKPENGLVILKAYHEAGQVVIEISDDGKGLDGEALAASAVTKGLITAEQAQAMSDKERVNLIFLPGFSTAAAVTDVSGRGVGMDVVKTNLDKLGGNVDIISEKGNGTTISIKLPLTLAIIPCQIIETGGERYAIPQVNLEELLRIPASQVKERVERVGNAEVVRLRGTLLPLIRLSDVIGAERTYYDHHDQGVKEDRREEIADRRGKNSPLFNDDSSNNKNSESNDKPRSVLDRRASASSALNIVVVSNGSMKYGLIVDRLQDSEEIVIKPLGRHLHQCKGYAGATIMGDGRIALILDVSNLARMANLTSIDGSDRAAEVAKAAEDAVRAKKEKQSLLIFQSSRTEHFAVPLNQVERIEKIKRSDIEELGGKRVMKYRGGSLSLICVDDVAMVAPLTDDENLLVIVFNIAKRPVGLLAIGPIDALEVSADIDDTTLSQPGIMGSIIINEHTTMLVNVFEMTQNLFPQWFEEQEIFDFDQREEAGTPPTILIAEDSKFFRNQVKGYMTEVGYNVIEAEDGLEGWNKLEEHSEEITLLVTDIEMPNMNGFELTQRIRADKRYSSLPVIALTTLASAEDVAKGKAVGINEYHIKLDKERLMVSVHDYIKRQH